MEIKSNEYRVPISEDVLRKALRQEETGMADLLREEGVECHLRFHYQVFQPASSRKKGALWR